MLDERTMLLLRDRVLALTPHLGRDVEAIRVDPVRPARHQRLRDQPSRLAERHHDQISNWNVACLEAVAGDSVAAYLRA